MRLRLLVIACVGVMTLHAQYTHLYLQLLYADSIADQNPDITLSICEQLAKVSSNSDVKLRTMLVLSNGLFHKGNYLRSFVILDSLGKDSKIGEDSILLHKYYFLMGRKHHFRGEHAAALNYYFKILDYSRRHSQLSQFAEINNIIGGIYLNQQEGQLALKYYHQGLRMQINQKNDYKTARGYLNVGNAYNQLKVYSLARVMLDSASYFYNKVDSKEGLSYVYATVAEIHTANKQRDSALVYLMKSREVLKYLNKLYALAQIDKDIAQLFMELGNYAKAEKFAIEGLDFAKESGQVHNEVPLLKLLSEIAVSRKDYKLALHYYQQHKSYSDSVLNVASIRKQTESALNYEFSKHQYERELALQKEKLQKESEIQKERIIIWGFTLLMAVTALLVYIRFRIKRKSSEALSKAYSLLEEKNKQIEQNTAEIKRALLEREILLREIHHRVKNNLQVISGLLELQKEELKEESSKAAFDEGQSRIRSISLIHQNLYQNEHLGSVRFNLFVKELSEQVIELYAKEGSHVQVTIDIPEFLLDVDTAVPLGLVINELLTNSFKYAFRSTNDGQITIKLERESDTQYILLYGDNGPGLSNPDNFIQSSTLGLRLIRGLSNQIGGQAHYRYNQGATFEVRFQTRASEQASKQTS